MGGAGGEERRPSHGLIFAVIGLALLVGVVGGGIAGGLVAALVPRDSASPTRAGNPAVAAGPTTLLSVKEESAITDAVAKVNPGVVTLLVEAQQTDAAGRVVSETNLGSGVVIDARGYIVTNQHVVDSATKISVRLPSGEERPGVLVGDDSPFTDIAVIRVQPDNLTVVPVGDSEALALGQQVLAIGSPAFGSSLTDVRNDFNNTVTRGIVCGIHRRWPREDTIMEDLIQTDAAVNHGNSGGALVTLNGDLVGITTTVVRGTDQGNEVQGVAFAISSRVFKPLVDQIIASGRVQRPYVGISHRQITPDIARQNRLPVQNGALVINVDGDSPAAKAGIQRGDIITKINNTPITEDAPYLSILVKQTPNTTVPVTYTRNGKETTVDVDIGIR
jgi:2-alkenal reductase